MKHVDVVIVSWAKDETLLEITRTAIDSLLKSESDICFHVYVIESNPEIRYDEFQRSPHTCETLHPEDKEFGYHKYLNIGVRAGNSPYIALCNSDLYFHPGWATALTEVMETEPAYLSASPWCSKSHGHTTYLKLRKGYLVRKHIAGWCIFQQRRIYDLIGELDERFKFWYCDDDYAEELRKHNILHCLVPTSRVDHREGKTLVSLPLEEKEEYTRKQAEIFVKKWIRNS